MSGRDSARIAAGTEQRARNSRRRITPPDYTAAGRAVSQRPNRKTPVSSRMPAGMQTIAAEMAARSGGGEQHDGAKLAQRNAAIRIMVVGVDQEALQYEGEQD